MPSSLTRKVARSLGEGQAVEELVTHAAMAFHFGGAREVVAAGLRGGGWAIAASASKGMDDPNPQYPGSLLPLPQRCIVALTDQRLLIFASSGWVNSPRQLVHDIPLSQIAWVGEPVSEGHVTKTERVIVGLTSGMLLGWEFPRLSARSGRALMTDLAHQVSEP